MQTSTSPVIYRSNGKKESIKLLPAKAIKSLIKYSSSTSTKPSKFKSNAKPLKDDSSPSTLNSKSYSFLCTSTKSKWQALSRNQTSQRCCSTREKEKTPKKILSYLYLDRLPTPKSNLQFSLNIQAKELESNRLEICLLMHKLAALPLTSLQSI